MHRQDKLASIRAEKVQVKHESTGTPAAASARMASLFSPGDSSGDDSATSDSEASSSSASLSVTGTTKPSIPHRYQIHTATGGVYTVPFHLHQELIKIIKQSRHVEPEVLLPKRVSPDEGDACQPPKKALPKVSSPLKASNPKLKSRVESASSTDVVPQKQDAVRQPSKTPLTRPSLPKTKSQNASPINQPPTCQPKSKEDAMPSASRISPPTTTHADSVVPSKKRKSSEVIPGPELERSPKRPCPPPATAMSKPSPPPPPPPPPPSAPKKAKKVTPKQPNSSYIRHVGCNMWICDFRSGINARQCGAIFASKVRIDEHSSKHEL